jgi:hypothetical protein
VESGQFGHIYRRYRSRETPSSGQFANKIGVGISLLAAHLVI